MLATALGTVLFLLSAIHVYWALGGRRGMAVVLPQREPGALAPAFIPGLAATLVVAGALATGGVLALALGGLARPFNIPMSWLRVLGGVGAVAFSGRVVGDSRLVGLFKKVRGTTFALWDTVLFTPLCALIAAAWIALVATAR
jgi:hypothetical protein